MGQVKDIDGMSSCGSIVWAGLAACHDCQLSSPTWHYIQYHLPCIYQLLPEPNSTLKMHDKQGQVRLFPEFRRQIS